MSRKYRVCPRCEGEGSIVNPLLSVWTEEDRDNDPDGFADMMAGVYDVRCTECDGLRVVTAADKRRYRERQSEHRIYLMESGIYPGSPDYDSL